MAAPTIRGSTAPVSGLSTTSPSGTAVGDLVVVATWERAGAGSPTHTLQSGYKEMRTHAHDDGSTDGRMSVAFKYATVAGAQSYQAYTTSGSGTVCTGCIVYQVGTYNPNDLVVNSQTTTTNAAPDPASVTGLTGDFSVMAFAGWHLGSAATVAVTPPTNYTEQWEIAGSTDVEFSLATRALTGQAAATENPGAFADDVAPNGTCTITIALQGVVSPTVYEVAAASSGTGAITPTMATHGTTPGWIVYVIVQTANQPTTLSTANGFVERTDMRVGTGTPGAAGAVGIQVFYQRAAGSTLSAPTVADSGDHTIVQCISTKDNWQDGNPWDAISTATYASGTAATAPTVTTQVPACTAFRIIGNAIDTTGNQGSSWTNASAEGFAQASDGVGGGFNVAASVFASAGATGTAGLTLASASAQASVTFAVSNAYTPGIQQQVTASPATATASAVTPILNDPSMRPAPATASATAVNPTFTLGNVNMSPAPAAATATGVTPTLTDTTLQLGAHGLDFQLFGHGNGPSSVTLTTTTGSMLLVFWGGATTDMATAPTDNKGNTFKLVDSVHAYPSYSQWATSIWVAHNITGGSSHTIEVICELFNESTLVVVEVLGGKVVRSVGYTSLPMASGSTTHVGPSLTATASCIELQVWWGESGVGQNHTASPNNGLTVIESYLLDDPDGYIQNATAWAAKSAGTHGVTWTVSPSQGFNAQGVIIQAEEVLPIATATATGVTPSFTGGNVEVTASPAAATAAAVTPTLTVGNVNVSPAPAAGTAAAVTPTLTVGGNVNLPASPATATSTGVNPTFTLGGLNVTASPATATSTGVNPTFTLGGLNVTASPAAATAAAIDPTLAVSGTAATTPAPAAATSTGVNPTFTLGNVSLPAAPATAIATGVNPTFTLGGLNVTASPAVATAAAVTPSLSPGSINLPASPATATATGVTPTLTGGNADVTASPAVATATGVTPTLALGGLNVTASPAAATATGVTPALTLGNVNLTVSPAAATASAVDPHLDVAGQESVTPPPAAATATGVNPTLTVSGNVNLPVLPATATAAAADPALAASGNVNLPASPAASAATSVTPTFTLGGLNVTASPAAATATAIDPVVAQGAATLAPAPAVATVSVPTPGWILGGTSFTAAPATAVARGVAPSVTTTDPDTEPRDVEVVLAEEAVTIRLLDETPLLTLVEESVVVRLL